MISVDEAQARLLALASPLPAIVHPLAKAARHYLHGPIQANRTQPAADLSAMDGYAVLIADFPGPWRVIGESAAGHPFSGALGGGEAVRVFTGAHVPRNADFILIQENARHGGHLVLTTQTVHPTPGTHIRRAGTDFKAGTEILQHGTFLSAGAIALAAMAGHGTLSVGQWPSVAIVATGDELTLPGAVCRTGQIPSSNSPMLDTMLSEYPCNVIDAGIIGDNLAELETKLDTLTKSADIIVTTGGASVGDHDLVQTALKNIGANMDFWKVAMRPGKPLMAGKIGDTMVLGLPGNPSSAFVTAFLFLLPLIRHMAGCLTPLPELFEGVSATALPESGVRAEYLRARIDGAVITPLMGQDSGLTAPLAYANALLLQPPHVPPRGIGANVQYIRLS